MKALFKIAEKVLAVGVLGIVLQEAETFAVQSFNPNYGDPMLESWRWRVFPELSGLGLQCMAEGKDGKMWFGTGEGAWSYDGLQWTSYGAKEGLPAGVDTLCTGGDGSVYAGGTWGVSRFQNGRWSPVLPSTVQNFGAVKDLAMAQDGSLWAATSWGVLRCKNSEYVLYTDTSNVSEMQSNLTASQIHIEKLPAAILSKPRPGTPEPNRTDFCEVYEGRGGSIWMGTDAGEVICLKLSAQGVEEPYTVADQVGEWALYNEADGMVLARRPRILQLANGDVWVVNFSSRGRANRFDGTQWKSIRLQDFGAPDDCTSLLETRDGVLWVGANGAVCANREGHWTVYEPPKVPIPTVRTILYQSSDGAMWIAGQDAEVLRLDYQTPRWSTYDALNFQWESPDGVQWFLHRDGRVVEHNGKEWRSYGPEDGLIDNPTTLLGTRKGEIWVAGSQEHIAATARLEGQHWNMTVHTNMSWGVDWRAAFESSDGSLWFGASVDSSGLGRKYLDGVMQYRDGKWTHHVFTGMQVPQATANALKSVDTSRNPAGRFYGLGESRDGRIWGGQGVVTVYDGTNWSILPQDDKFRIGVVEAMFTSLEGELWVGSRQYGAFRFDGRNWQRFHVRDGLVANTIRSITQTTDRNVWVATDRGISCFDGQNWTSEVLPLALNMAREAGSLKASPSGALWINRSTRNWTRRAWPKSAPVDTTTCEFWTVCFRPERVPPHTSLTLAPDKVEQPGNVTLSWKGTAPWRSTKESRLQFSYRLDRSPWSPYDSEATHSFFALASGGHHFEVRARDGDFNVDPRPASLNFVVLPPVWKQAWFLGLMLVFSGAVATQSIRVFLHGRHLRKSNAALAAEVEERKRMQLQIETAHKELVEASRQAGMAEVATSILHNVGNVLNSVNVSADLVSDRVRRSKVDSLPKLSKMLAEHASEPNFLSSEKGRQISTYLASLGEHFATEQTETLNELASLRQNITHIKDIIAMQQEYSKVAGFTEPVKLTELVEDALRLNEGALLRHKVELFRDFQENGTVVVEKHKVLQILVNLIRNAKYACDDSNELQHRLLLRTRASGNDRVQIQVCDNGVGIPAENLTKIFSQGFTTRKNGHGFGLHSAANAARDLGGKLTVASDGQGKGATFTLEFPTKREKTTK